MTAAARVKECPGSESNRYVPFGTRDFKSSARFLVVLSHLAFAMTCTFLSVAIRVLLCPPAPIDGTQFGTEELFAGAIVAKDGVCQSAALLACS
jgi:hypothetical protein